MPHTARCLFLLAALLAAPLVAAEPPEAWTTAIRQARAELARGEYSPALEHFREALAIVDTQPGQEPSKLETFRYLTAASRAGGNAEDAALYLANSIRIEESMDPQPKGTLAADLTSMASLQKAAGDVKSARESLLRAVALWKEEPSTDGLRELTAMDTLAGLHRDASEYEEAEALLTRALRIREAAYGPNAADLIATVDSLAYVLFGQRKFTEAEPLYKRLLALWVKSGGEEHPMVALTLDKMAEFYAAQQKYDLAEPLVAKSLQIRTNSLMASFLQTGRIDLMEAKLDEARELFTRAVRIGDDCKVDDGVMDPLLRIQATLLRSAGKSEEADAIDARVKAATLRKAQKEGFKTPPGKK